MDGTLPMIKDWDFDVETYDLKVNKLSDDNIDVIVPPSMAQAVVRTDTNSILGVHTDKYKIIKSGTYINKTAYQYACENNNFEIKKYLIDRYFKSLKI